MPNKTNSTNSKKAENDERAQEMEIQRYVSTLEYYKAQLEAMAKQGEMLSALLSEQIRAKDTLQKYKNAKDGEELLIPIGSEVFVFAKAAQPQKVIINIGASVLVEEDADSVNARLDERIKDSKETAEKLEEGAMKIQQHMAILSQQVEEMYRKLQEGHVHGPECDHGHE